MKDAYYPAIVVVSAALCGIVYGVRILIGRGAAHSERVSKIGGTVLVGRGIMDFTYWMLDPIVSGLARLGVTPNGLTWSALVFGLGAGVALAFGQLGLAALLATMSTFGDILDGQVARLTQKGSNRGELLDAAVDRYTEFAFLAGLAILFREQVGYLCLTLSALLASFMVSYASAKAEAMQVETPRGLMRRHERGLYLIVGAGFSAMFGPWLHEKIPDLPWFAFQLAGLAAVALFGNLAAVLRFVRIARGLR